MTILFSNSSPKYPNKALWVQNLGIFIISGNFEIRRIQRCWFQMWRYYLRIAVLLKNLQLNKFEGADFKYDNSFFLILPPKYANIAFLVPNLGIFVFHKNWQLEKFEGAENRTIHFWTSSLKIPKSGNFPSKFRDLYFAPNFALRQIWRRWFQIWQWLFRIPA